MNFILGTGLFTIEQIQYTLACVGVVVLFLIVLKRESKVVNGVHVFHMNEVYKSMENYDFLKVFMFICWFEVAVILSVVVIWVSCLASLGNVSNTLSDFGYMLHGDALISSTKVLTSDSLKPKNALSNVTITNQVDKPVDSFSNGLTLYNPIKGSIEGFSFTNMPINKVDEQILLYDGSTLVAKSSVLKPNQKITGIQLSSSIATDRNVSFLNAKVLYIYNGKVISDSGRFYDGVIRVVNSYSGVSTMNFVYSFFMLVLAVAGLIWVLSHKVAERKKKALESLF